LKALTFALAVVAGLSQRVAAIDAPANFVLHPAPIAMPEIHFEDGHSAARLLTDFRSRVVLLNLWATWCSPCRRELPSLDRLQGALGGSSFEVVALSIDRAGLEPVRRFYEEVGVKVLAIYVDTSSKALREFGAIGLPTTVLIDREGRELGRLVGPAEWDAPDMMAFLRDRIDANAIKSSN
jgi:thiol-disulfide isomerase/thioredoxin